MNRRDFLRICAYAAPAVAVVPVARKIFLPPQKVVHIEHDGWRFWESSIGVYDWPTMSNGMVPPGDVLLEMLGDMRRSIEHVTGMPAYRG